MTRAVFLDRDGVLIRTYVRDGVSYPPANLAQVQILPGVPQALLRLRELHLLLIVVTNQPDVARKTQSRQTVESINALLREQLPLDDVYVCYHDTPDRCDCRKPLPGLLLQAAARHTIDLRRSFLVGDRWSDIKAGQAAGCRSLLLDCDHSGRQKCDPDDVVADLPAAALRIETLLNHEPTR